MSDKQKIQLALKPLFLTTQEAKGHEQVYNAIIEKNYPNLKNVNQEEFKKIKSRLNEKNAQKELKNVILKIAFDEIINLNLNYDIAGYDFEDQMQDVVLFIGAFDNGLNTSNLRFIHGWGSLPESIFTLFDSQQ